MTDEIGDSMGEEMGDGIDPSSFGEDLDVQVADGHTDAEGMPEADAGEMGSASRWREMLLSSEPETPLEEVESPWQPETGGITRIWRGILKMGSFNGMPAVLDILIGMAELFWAADGANSGDGSSDESDASVIGGEETVETVPGGAESPDMPE